MESKFEWLYSPRWIAAHLVNIDETHYDTRRQEQRSKTACGRWLSLHGEVEHDPRDASRCQHCLLVSLAVA